MTRIPDVNPIKAHLNIFVKTICQRLKKLKLDWGIAEEVEKFSMDLEIQEAEAPGREQGEKTNMERPSS
jgi:hypothetical protein